MQTNLNKKSNFFERILQIVDYYKIKSVNELAKGYLNYNSSEKLSRLKKENTNPSLEIIQDISNKFVEIRLDWLINGNGEMIKSKESDSKVSEPKVHYGKCQNCSALEKEINRLQTELIELKD